jgi:hypothetical protein
VAGVTGSAGGHDDMPSCLWKRGHALMLMREGVTDVVLKRGRGPGTAHEPPTLAGMTDARACVDRLGSTCHELAVEGGFYRRRQRPHPDSAPHERTP